MRPSSALSIFVLLASLSGNVIAQGNNNNNNNNNNNQNSVSGRPPPLASNTEDTPAPTNPPASQSNTQNDDKPSKTDDDKPQQTKDDNKPDQTKEDPPPPQKTSEVPEQDEDAPSLSSKTGVTVIGTGGSSSPTGGSDDPPPPKYTPPDNSRYKVPEYPPPAVPNTKNAPYMQRSDLPEGTVFIAVGAALGLIGLIAFAWRMVVAWQLRRSIRRANVVTVDSKAGLLGRYNAPSTTKKSFYSAGAGSSLSLDHLGTASRTTGLGTTPNTSLFFSPTANNGNSHQRQSQYLPAGYYAPAASTNLPFNQSRDSLPLPRPRPATRDSHVVGTPPASPLLTPTARRPSPGQGHAQAPSISSTLGVPAGGRTPSTYLEDMLDNPFPEEPGMAADQNRRNSRHKSGHSYGGGAGGSGSRR